MTMSNHLRMGRLILEDMARNDMPLKRKSFALGNLAPDLIGTNFILGHKYAQSSSLLCKLLKRLFRSGAVADGMKFSFFAGVMAHLICDYYCYPHTAAFSGSVREHIRHERGQTVRDDEMLPFDKRRSMNYSFSEFCDALGERIAIYERFLSEYAGAPSSDIPLAVHMATWAASAAYLHARHCPRRAHFWNRSKNTATAA